MSSSGGKSFVLVAALLSACAWVIAQRARSWWAGEGRLAGADGAPLAFDGTLVRHAQWAASSPLPAPLPGNPDVSRPAISADGRWLAFAAGERGQDVGLYLCERHGDALGAAQRLAELDSPADELAPAFGAGYLYFASDRAGGAGGLDLWRASFAAGVTGEPEHLGGALASGADDTDPAPCARAGELVFASNRGGDFDLYLGLAAEGAGASVLRLEQLASPADEREPVFASAEQVLAFATDRRARGDFDLWRSVRTLGALERGEPWPAPQPIEGLNSAESERGPAFAPDAFEITFTRAPAGARGAMWQARSREVFEIPRRAWTWFDTAVVGSLLLLAVVTWLARRAPALELLYKCLLVSVLLHLLLLFALQYWLLGGGQVPQGEPTRQRVRFVPGASAPSASSERAGRLEARLSTARSGPERAELARPGAPAVPEAAPLVDLPEGERPSAPERGRVDLPAAEGELQPAVALARPSEAPAMRAEPAAALALSADARPVRAESAGPQRAALEAGSGEATVAPSATATLAQRPSDGPAPAPTRARAQDGPGAGDSRSSAAVLVAQPSAAGTARRGAPAAALELGAATASAARAHPGPSEADAASLGSSPASGLAQPRELGGLARSVHAAESAAPARAADAAPGPAARSAPSVALEGPAQSGGGVAPRSDPAPGLALGSASASAGAVGARSAGPSRASLSAPDAQAERGAPTPGSLALGAPRAASAAAEPPARAASEPGSGAQPGAHALALEDAERGPLRHASDPAPPGDLGSTLVPSALAGRPASGTGGPASSLAPPALESSGREPKPVPGSTSPLARSPAEDRALPPVERRPWDHTPYENRAGAEKARALALHGGDEHTEEAVARGLAYLARMQHKDGSWGPVQARDDKYGQICIGKTGLSLLAFLGAGHTQRSGTLHSEVVQRALGFLCSAQQPDSGHIGDGDAYGHGIATYALAECLAMTGDERLRPVLERAVAQILAHQDRHQDPRLFGGWSYYFADGHEYDRWPRAPITAWQVMALESARLSGLSVPDAVFEAAQQFLENTRDDEAGYWRYNHDTTRHYATLPASTPAGMFALSLMGADLAAPDYAKLRRFVLERRPDGYRYEDDDAFVAHGTGNLYFWYYGTLAMFRAGGASWASWNEGMKQTLVPAQNRDGSWEPIDPYARYARDGAGDKSYTTALCVLSLEVYYRYYLPLLKVR